MDNRIRMQKRIESRRVVDEEKLRWQVSELLSPQRISVFVNARKQKGHLGRNASKNPLNMLKRPFGAKPGEIFLQGLQSL